MDARAYENLRAYRKRRGRRSVPPAPAAAPPVRQRPERAAPVMDFPALDKMARGIAGRYASRYGVAIADLYQDAWIAILESQRSWQAPLGPFQAYAATAVWRTCLVSAVRMRSPVKGSKHATGKLLQTWSVDLDHAPEGSTELHHTEVQVTKKQVAERMRRVFELQPDGTLAARVLLNNERAEDVARDAGVNKWRIYRATRNANAALRADPLLQQLGA